MCCGLLGNVPSANCTAVVEACPSPADEPGRSWHPGGGREARGPAGAKSPAPEASGCLGLTVSLTLAHLRQVLSPWDTPIPFTGEAAKPRESQHQAEQAGASVSGSARAHRVTPASPFPLRTPPSSPPGCRDADDLPRRVESSVPGLPCSSPRPVHLWTCLSPTGTFSVINRQGPSYGKGQQV